VVTSDALPLEAASPCRHFYGLGFPLSRIAPTYQISAKSAMSGWVIGNSTNFRSPFYRGGDNEPVLFFYFTALYTA